METSEALKIVFAEYPNKLFRVDSLRNEVSKLTGGIPDDFVTALREFKDDPNNGVCMVWEHKGIGYIKSNLKYYKNKHNALQNVRIKNAIQRIKA